MNHNEAKWIDHLQTIGERITATIDASKWGQHDSYAIVEAVDREIAPLVESHRELEKRLKAFVDPWSRGGEWQSKLTYDTFNDARTALAAAAKVEGGE